MRTPPPRKKSGQARGRRAINGVMQDVHSMAGRLGVSEGKVRNDVARGLLPHRKLGGRIFFLIDEVDEFLRKLPGITVQEALENMERRS